MASNIRMVCPIHKKELSESKRRFLSVWHCPDCKKFYSPIDVSNFHGHISIDGQPVETLKPESLPKQRKSVAPKKSKTQNRPTKKNTPPKKEKVRREVWRYSLSGIDSWTSHPTPVVPVADAPAEKSTTSPISVKSKSDSSMQLVLSRPLPSGYPEQNGERERAPDPVSEQSAGS